MTFHLNWLEIKRLTEFLSQETQGLFLERMIIPSRPEFPEGYLKKEWAFRLTGKQAVGVLIISLRPQHPYFYWMPGKGPKASPTSTRSAFDLMLNKKLKGSKLLEITSVEKDRMAILWFSNPDLRDSKLGLILSLIPSSPEGILVSKGLRENDPMMILTRSNSKKNANIPSSYQLPDPSKAPKELQIRMEWLEPPKLFASKMEELLKKEAFQLRIQAAERLLKSALKQASESAAQSEEGLKKTEKEPNWQRYGDLLKGEIGKKNEGGIFREVQDYETGELLKLPVDPNLTFQEQIEVFYRKAKRKKRKLLETKARLKGFLEKIASLEKSLSQKPKEGEWEKLNQWESDIGVPKESLDSSGKDGRKKGPIWLGRSYQSQEGLTILVGRDKTENLELTFKHARGNDLWLHVRGKPGAHVVILLPSGRTASLETLLDAAQLVVHFSGGANAGKTEVDYTYKKYVKRIRDSTEASYTHNKTLLILPDPKRIKRLFAYER